MLKTNISRLREAVILGFFCLSEPAAAFLGFLKAFSPFCSCSSTREAKTALGIYTSPLTSIVTSFFRRRGIELTVRRLAVTSSPTFPSPLVEPLTKTPFSYSSATERPSILGSTTYSASGNIALILESNALTSSMPKASCKLSRGTA